MLHVEPSRTHSTAPGRILRAATALASGEILARVAAFGATVLLARRLGPDGFGVIGFTIALCGYIMLAVDSGLNDVGSREVARAPDRAVDVYFSVASVRLLLAVAAFLLLAVVAGVLPKPPLTRVVLLLTGLSFFSLALNPAWVMRGLERPVLAALGLVLAQVVYAVGVFLVISGPEDVAFVPVLQFTGELSAALLLCIILLKGRRPSLVMGEGIRVLQSSGYLGLGRIFRAIVVTFDVVLLGFMATNRDVGLYTAAYRVIYLLMSMVASISAAFIPSYARVVVAAQEPPRQLVGDSLRLSATIGAPLVGGVIVTARPMLELVFGPEYVDAANALRLLALSVGAMFLSWPVINVLIATHRTRLFAIVRAVAAVLNIGLNLVLIPRFGINGAAAATLAAEVALLVQGAWLLQTMHALPSPGPLVRPLGATVCMSVAIWTIGSHVSFGLNVALGAAIYAAALGAMGGEPLSLLRDAVGRRSAPAD